MLLSLSDRLDLVITENHMNKSIVQVMQTLSSTKSMIVGEGKAEKAREAKIILNLISNALDHKMTRKQLLVRGFGDFDVNDLDRVMSTFEQGKLVKKWESGKDTWYKLTDTAITLLTKFEKEEKGEI